MVKRKSFRSFILIQKNRCLSSYPTSKNDNEYSDLNTNLNFVLVSAIEVLYILKILNNTFSTHAYPSQSRGSYYKQKVTERNLTAESLTVLFWLFCPKKSTVCIIHTTISSSIWMETESRQASPLIILTDEWYP